MGTALKGSAVEDRYHTIRGEKIYVKTVTPDTPRRHGSPSILLLHEGLGSVGQWKSLPEKLATATGLTCIAYDRSGYGRSGGTTRGRTLDYLEREAFDSLPIVIDALALEKPVLFGHSDGGTIALLYASKHGENVSGIVTAAAHVFVDEITLQGIRETGKEYATGNVRQGLCRYHGDKTDDVFRSWYDTWLSPGYRNWNIVRYLGNIRNPLLVIQGEDDIYGTREQVDAIARSVAGYAETLWIKGCGHSPHREAGERVIKATRVFIESRIFQNG